MTDTHIFRVLGLIYLAFGAGAAIDPQHYQEVMRDFSQSYALVYVGGVLALVVGYLLVVIRKRGVTRWSVIITIIGCLVIVKGILLLVIPGAFASAAAVVGSSETRILTIGIVSMLFGGVLSVLGRYTVRE